MIKPFVIILLFAAYPVLSETVTLKCKMSEKGGLKITWNKLEQVASMEMIINQAMVEDTPEARDKVAELKRLNEQSEPLPTLEEKNDLVIRQEQTKFDQVVSNGGESISFDIHVVTDTVIDRVNLDIYMDVKTFSRGMDGGENWIPYNALTNKKKIGTCEVEHIAKRQF